MMFNLVSLLFSDDIGESCPKSDGHFLSIYIELVVVTVVGSGELVENSGMSWRDAGVSVSTGL